MGLDIVIIKNAIKVPTPKTHKEGVIMLCNVRGCTQNVQHESAYTGEHERVWSAPYSTYGTMRRRLASMINKTPEQIWENPKEDIPFVRLIDFSYCEGGFDNEACKQLAEEFTQFMPQAEKLFDEDEDFKAFYTKLHYGFNQCAQTNGVLYFT